MYACLYMSVKFLKLQSRWVSKEWKSSSVYSPTLQGMCITDHMYATCWPHQLNSKCHSIADLAGEAANGCLVDRIVIILECCWLLANSIVNFIKIFHLIVDLKWIQFQPECSDFIRVWVPLMMSRSFLLKYWNWIHLWVDILIKIIKFL